MNESVFTWDDVENLSRAAARLRREAKDAASAADGRDAIGMHSEADWNESLAARIAALLAKRE